MKKIFLLTFGIIFLSGCDSDSLILKSNDYVIELGNPVSASPNDYLKEDTPNEIVQNTYFSLSNPSENDEKELKENVVLGTSYSINEESYIVSNEKTYLDVGEYTFYLYYDHTQYYFLNKREIEEINIKVHDTTTPTLTLSKDSVSIYVGDNLNEDNIMELISCKDLSNCEISVDMSNVDTKKAGSYTVNVVAKDLYENKTQTNLKIEVLKRPVVNTYTTNSNSNKSHIFKGDGNISEAQLTLADSELRLIPSGIVNAALANGWTFYVTSKDIASNYYIGDSSKYWGQIVALTMQKEKKVYIQNTKIKTSSRSVIHEMGHVLDLMNGVVSNTTEFDNIYNEEKEKYPVYTGDVNPDRIIDRQEYFASSFMQYITNRNGIKNNAPKTFSYIENLVSKY